ncbi:MAG: SDR family NAD(P)-dependent oxidoreductase [Hyphomicrobium sp.]|nr:SDR family NAD(P)-dependent oxidoreductase [Hyphomicrobium sp.]
MVDLKDRAVLITGAGRGIGLAYARSLASLGALVFIQDTGADARGQGCDSQVAEDAATLLRSEGLAAYAVTEGIATRDECHRLIERCIDFRGRLDGILHNAGWVDYEAIETVQEETFDRMMAIGAKTPLWLAQAAWPAMKAARYGRIVVTTSDRALYPQYVQSGLSAYAAAKMAAVGIVNVLAAEGAAHGIVVNAISPVAKTRMWGIEGEPSELRPSDVAAGAAYMLSDACTEGGWVLRASNGQFHATRATEAPDVDYPRDLRAVSAATADDIAANWPRIAMPAVEARA